MSTNKIHNEDCLEGIEKIPDNTIQSVITSPPYFGLRDYGVDGQLGLEPSPQEYIKKLVSLFDGIKRVLKNDGCLFVNIGDSYSGNCSRRDTGRAGFRDTRDGVFNKAPGIKAKSLIGIPARFQIAMIDNGWICRNDIIWNKPNPLPEPVKDRFTRSHEYIFMFVLNQKYKFNQQLENGNQEGSYSQGTNHKKGMDKVYKTQLGRTLDMKNGKRNMRDVFNVAPSCSSVEHFASYPEMLIKPLLLGSTNKDDIILDPFMGSGTTAVSAIKHNRKYIGFELSKKYCDIAEERIQEARGLFL